MGKGENQDDPQVVPEKKSQKSGERVGRFLCAKTEKKQKKNHRALGGLKVIERERLGITIRRI